MGSATATPREVCTLFNTARPADRVTAVARAALSRCNPGAACPTYFSALSEAVSEELPPFATDRYREIYRAAAMNESWLAISLMTNAEREGDGARRLWSLAACSDNEREALLLKRHAVDESRHALLYLALLDLCFPAIVAPAFRLELNGLSPEYSMDRALAPEEGSPYARTPSLDDFMQMNIAEIRTTLHHAMQRLAVAEHCPADSLPQATAILDALLHDELHHVSYTALLIERHSHDAEASRFRALFCKRVRDFNRITSEELERKIFDS